MSSFLKNNTDEELVLMFALKENEHAMAELFERYNPLLLGLCLKYFKDLSKAEDAVMEIFEAVIIKINDHKIQHFKSWLYTVAKNHCLMALRKKELLFYSDAIIMEFDSSEHLYKTDLNEKHLRRLEECIDKLKPHQKSIINAFFLEKNSYSTIANEQNISTNKVKSYVQNGKRNLKNCMDK